jgi:hypothetical protein
MHYLVCILPTPTPSVTPKNMNILFRLLSLVSMNCVHQMGAGTGRETHYIRSTQLLYLKQKHLN